MKKIIPVIIVCVLIYFAYSQLTKGEETIIKMQLVVDKKIGFNVSKEIINFGNVPPGAKSETKIYLRNDGIRKHVTIKATGDISHWIFVSENNFVLKPYENKTINITAIVPKNAKYGRYEGKLKIIYK